LSYTTGHAAYRNDSVKHSRQRNPAL